MSDNITKRVGLGTAYGFAKAGGYEGTVAEFTELLGNIAIDLARIENLSVTVTTLPAGSQATASLNGSVLSLGIPKGDKGDKGNTGDTGSPAGFGTVSATVDDTIGTPSVEVTASGADTAKNFAFAFHNLKGQKGDKGDTGEVSEAELTQAFEDFSANGTVANAEQLTTDIRANDQTPYLFRTAGGSVDIGDREYINGIVGGTVAWNQLAPKFESDSRWEAESGVTASFDNGVAEFTSTAMINGIKTGGLGVQIIGGHKYLALVSVKSSSSASGQSLRIIASGQATPFFDIVNFTASFSTLGVVATAGSNQNLSFYIYPTSSVTLNATISLKDFTLFDLTAMFGSTIADYIYSLEQANAGAGVAFFRKLFPKPYYAYNAGELKSVSGLVSHDMVGFNAWDEEWESGYYNRQSGAKAGNSDTTYFRSKNYIPCLPNTSYYFKSPTAHANNNSYYAVLFYDADKSFISADNNLALYPTKTTPNNACYMTFYIEVGTSGATYKNDICINLSRDGERDGEYEEYVKHSYALDSDLVLRGIPKLDNGNLYYDGDVYEADGTVTRKYGDYVFTGNETIVMSTSTPQSGTAFRVTFPSGHNYKNAAAVGSDINILSNKYVAIEGRFGVNAMNAGECKQYGDTSNVYFCSTASTVEAFKAELTGTHLVYELATPTTENADPYTNPQIVNDFGTEEFVISNTVDVPIPVGNNTDYPINLKAKVEMAPNSPDGDGDYIVRQTNGTNEYVTLANNATIQNILSRLEALEG